MPQKKKIICTLDISESTLCSENVFSCAQMSQFEQNTNFAHRTFRTWQNTVWEANTVIPITALIYSQCLPCNTYWMPTLLGTLLATSSTQPVTSNPQLIPV